MTPSATQALPGPLEVVVGVDGYETMDAWSMAEAVRGGLVHPLELVDAAIARIEARSALHAVIRTRFERARDEARGELPEGPLRGIPVLLKDLHATLAGEPTGNGTALLQGLERAETSTLVERLRAAGAVILGQTNTPEFGLMGITEPRAVGPTRNPWDREHSPGGSSGGSAAAVAARLVPIAHASDGGGSIRIPASHNGLFGLKPTRARTPCGPSEVWGWQGLAIEHAVSRTVRDSALWLDAIAGPTPGAPYQVVPPERPYVDELGADPGRLRIAVAEHALLGGENDAEVLQALDDAATLAESLGHTVERVSPPVDATALRRAYFTCVASGIHGSVHEAARLAGTTPRARDFERTTWTFHRIGALLSAGDLEACQQDIAHAGFAWARFFERFDVVLTPTCARPPARIGELYPSRGVERQMRIFDLPLGRSTIFSLLDRMAEQALSATPNTQVANLIGLPAMSTPLTWSASGLPLGTQWIAPFGGEDVIFRLASQLEAARPWADRVPPGLEPV